MMKVVDGLLAGLFFLAAAVQYNDPDSLAWIVLYGAVALLAGLAFFGKHLLPLAAGVGVASLVALVLTASGFADFLGQEAYGLTAEMADEAPFVEQAREFLGALLVLAAAVFYLWRARRHAAKLRFS